MRSRRSVTFPVSILIHDNSFFLRVECGGHDGTSPDFLLRIVLHGSAFRPRDENRAILQFGHTDGDAGAFGAGDDGEIVVAKDIGGLVVNAVPPIAAHAFDRLDAGTREARAVMPFYEFKIFREFEDDVAWGAVGQAARQPDVSIPGGHATHSVVVLRRGNFLDKFQRLSVIDMDEIFRFAFRLVECPFVDRHVELAVEQAWIAAVAGGLDLFDDFAVHVRLYYSISKGPVDELSVAIDALQMARVGAFAIDGFGGENGGNEKQRNQQNFLHLLHLQYLIHVFADVFATIIGRAADAAEFGGENIVVTDFTDSFHDGWPVDRAAEEIWRGRARFGAIAFDMHLLDAAAERENPMLGIAVGDDVADIEISGDVRRIEIIDVARHFGRAEEDFVADVFNRHVDFVLFEFGHDGLQFRLRTCPRVFETDLRCDDGGNDENRVRTNGQRGVQRLLQAGHAFCASLCIGG